MEERFLLPDRFEGLSESASDKDIAKIIIPVKYGLDKIQDIYEEICSSNRGSFLILKGESGSGKTTFLRTISMFIESVEVLTIPNNSDIIKFIDELNTTTENLRIVIIEGRESILDMGHTEVTAAIHTINSFIRSTKGKNL